MLPCTTVWTDGSKLADPSMHLSTASVQCPELGSDMMSPEAAWGVLSERIQDAQVTHA